MGFDIHYFPDPEAEPWKERDGLKLRPLPPLPDGRLCSIGGFLTVAHALTQVRANLRRVPDNDNEVWLRDQYLAYIEADSENAREKFATCAKFISGFVGVPQWQVLTHTAQSAEELRDSEVDADVQVLLGKLLASGAATERDTAYLAEASVLWAHRALERVLDANGGADAPPEYRPLLVAHEILRTVAIYASYVRRLGGSYSVDY